MQELKRRWSKITDFVVSEQFFFLLIMYVILALPIVELFDQFHGKKYCSQPIIVEMAGISGVFGIITSFLKRQKQEKTFLSDVLFFTMLLVSVLSAAFTLNMEETYGGDFYYDEAITHFFAYFSLMFAGTMIQNKHYRRLILKAVVIVTVIQGIVAALQTCGIFLSVAYYDGDRMLELRESYGLLQHSNWYGGLSVLFFACVSGIFLYSDNKWVRNTACGISMLCFYTLISSGARLAWVGAFAYVLFLVLSFLIMKKHGYSAEKLRSIWKRFGILIVSMVAIVIFCDVTMHRISQDIAQSMLEVNSNDNLYLGNHRLYLWSYALQAVPQHWWLGVGLDNFRDVFFLNPNFPEGEWTNGKAHNELIHILATQGVFQLLNFVLLYIHAAVTGVRTVLHTDDEEDRFTTWIFLGMFAGYLAQSMFNSSVTNASPYFWITLGMCLSRKYQHEIGWKKAHSAAAKQS